MQQSNEQTLELFSRTLDYIDIDDPRFTNKIILERIKVGETNTYSDRYVLSNKDLKVKLSDVQKTLPDFEEYIDMYCERLGVSKDTILYHRQVSSKVIRFYMLHEGRVVVFLSVGIDDDVVAFSIVGDVDPCKMWMEQVRDRHNTKGFVRFDQITGFSSGYPTIRKHVISAREQEKFSGLDVFYPFIEGGIDKLVDDFTQSSASVLLLIGARGLGKTSLIRAITSRMDRKTNILASDENVVLHPDFMTYIQGVEDGSTISIEDADNLCDLRANGNTSMSALLNWSDGIVKNNTKMIISTNLVSLNKVDSALYRPGRTFRVIEFRELNLDEANDVRTAIGLETLNFKAMGLKKNTISLAHAINYEDWVGYEKDVGFGFI